MSSFRRTFPSFPRWPSSIATASKLPTCSMYLSFEKRPSFLLAGSFFDSCFFFFAAALAAFPAVTTPTEPPPCSSAPLRLRTALVGLSQIGGGLLARSSSAFRCASSFFTDVWLPGMTLPLIVCLRGTPSTPPSGGSWLLGVRLNEVALGVLVLAFEGSFDPTPNDPTPFDPTRTGDDHEVEALGFSEIGTSSSSVDSEPEFDDSDDSEVESLYIELSWATWPSSSPASVVRAPTFMDLGSSILSTAATMYTLRFSACRERRSPA
mmetsp:Transcript_54072/g.149192  ORF Transcript_54072/g.149192 Transcript_54072/m.149192 type:complete len:265 (-) Transcript_54072:340-1134(-)